MQNVELVRWQLDYLVTQARQDLCMLSSVYETAMKSQIMHRLWDKLSMIHFLSQLLANQARTSVPLPVVPLPGQPVSPPDQRTFTTDQLLSFDGKNGKPAYVAVNGTVYDVTNNRAWAAATHFGLTAGKDYTREFASCHTGQQSILATMPVVGRLV